MSSFNLNNPADFARMTTGNVVGILNNFNGNQPTQWDIFEASYISNASVALGKQPVKFLIFTNDSSDPAVYSAAVKGVIDKFGRRKVKYAYPYRDGQTSDDLGRKGQTFEFDCLIYGPNYLQGLQLLLVELNDPTPGILSHPIYGDIQVAATDQELTHESNSRLAVAMKLTFEEHNFSIGQISFEASINDSTTQGKLSALAGSFQKLSNAITAVGGNLSAAQSLKNQIVSAIGTFQTGYATLAAQLNSAFGNGTFLPALLPVNQGGIQSSGGSIVSTTPATVVSASDPFLAVPIDQLSASTAAALAAQALQKSVQANRDQATAIIQQIESVPNGALDLHDNILDIKNTVLAMQAAYEAGVASSNASLVNYTTPWDMSVREIAYQNGLTPDNGIDILLLNPQIESANYVPMGTSVLVATP